MKRLEIRRSVRELKPRAGEAWKRFAYNGPARYFVDGRRVSRSRFRAEARRRGEPWAMEQ
jgi:hypothetical protein